MKIPFVNRNTTFANNTFEINFDYSSTSNAGYLRNIAIQSVVGHVARSISYSKFRFMRDGVRQRGDLDYLLNVKPNTDQSASEFWYHFTFKLITENKVLAFMTDDGQLIVADSFQRNEYALLPDTFSGVTYKNYTYQRTFNADDVIFIQYSNVNVTRFLDKMYDDFTKLYNNMYITQLRNNQLRGILKIDANQAQDERRQQATQNLVDKIFKSFSEKAVSIIPLFKGFEYDEISNGSVSTGSSSDLNQVVADLTNELADIVGVPRALIHGDLAGQSLETILKAYIKFTINPLNKMIEDELNSKLIGKDDYINNNEYITVFGLQVRDVTESAEAVDKLISSSAFTANEVRGMFGYDYSDDPKLNEHIVTKNYTSLDEGTTSTSGGGENN